MAVVPKFMQCCLIKKSSLASSCYLPLECGTSGLKFKAAAAKSLRSSPTLCDPIDGSPPGPPSLGFSGQEHWSGLPFPSPVPESESWSVMSDS